tara:strand:+ start:791 stop:937 length:147 start_codon:yes stop_codon:yes gene_type:complete
VKEEQENKVRKSEERNKVKTMLYMVRVENIIIVALDLGIIIQKIINIL